MPLLNKDLSDASTDCGREYACLVAAVASNTMPFTYNTAQRDENIKRAMRIGFARLQNYSFAAISAVEGVSVQRVMQINKRLQTWGHALIYGEAFSLANYHALKARQEGQVK